jgi:2-acylglycerol O-acyltransferase 2
MENHKQEEQEQGELTTFKARELFSSNIILSLIAVAIWLGSIHFVVLLVIFSLLFLSFSKCLL